MKFRAALLAALTFVALFAVYVVASFSMAYPEEPIAWILIVAIIALLAVSYRVILRVRGER